MSSGCDLYDVIVVGAGVEGSSTAYQLAKRGSRVLLLEQFPLPHGRGSSHGHSRITRKVYGDQEFYTHMMKEAYTLTDELQKDSGQLLFTNCGCLVFGKEGNGFVKGAKAAVKRHGVPHETFSIKEQRKRYPNLSFPDNYEFLLDKSGGVLHSDKMLDAYQTLYKNYGGILKDGEAMIDLEPGHEVKVTTDKDVYRGRSVVLTLGPWAAKFLPKLGIQESLQPLKILVCYWKMKISGEFGISRFPTFIDTEGIGRYDVYGLPAAEYPGLIKALEILVCYWKTKNPGEFDISRFPTFIDKDAFVDHTTYGLPTAEYPGLIKICLHHGEAIDPDGRDRNSRDWLDMLKGYIATHFPSLVPEPSIVESCIYTNTPDHDYILDVHPKWKNVVIGAGFSGHGFKLSPVVGKILADLATGRKSTYDLTPFRLNRQSIKHKL